MSVILSTANKTTKRTHNKYGYTVHSWESGKTLLTNSDGTRAFAYSPPAQPLLKDEFLDAASPYDVIVVKRLDEGTMLHFFWNPETSDWNISTRNGVGCNCSYNKPVLPCRHTPEYINAIVPACKTFSQMAADAIAEFVRSETGEYQPLDDINSSYLLDLLPKEYTYSCLLRHAENHLVYSVAPTYPRLICKEIRRFEVLPEDGVVYINTIPRGDEVWEHAHCVFTKQPDEYNSDIYVRNDLDQIIDPVFRTAVLGFCQEDMANFSETIYPVGWSLTNMKTGDTTEVKNPRYEELHKLRNLNPDMRQQYIELFSRGLVDKYISTFPQYSCEFNIFGMELDNLTQIIHNAYVQYYIHKNREHIPKHYFVQAAKLHHDVYLANPEKRVKITQKVVRDYLAGLSANDLSRLWQ